MTTGYVVQKHESSNNRWSDLVAHDQRPEADKSLQFFRNNRPSSQCRIVFRQVTETVLA